MIVTSFPVVLDGGVDVLVEADGTAGGGGDEGTEDVGPVVRGCCAGRTDRAAVVKAFRSKHFRGGSALNRRSAFHKDHMGGHGTPTMIVMYVMAVPRSTN
jgi:hypothetical protein